VLGRDTFTELFDTASAVDAAPYLLDGDDSTVRDLLARYGPCTLAYRETIVRVADWRASAGQDLAAEPAGGQSQ